MRLSKVVTDLVAYMAAYGDVDVVVRDSKDHSLEGPPWTSVVEVGYGKGHEDKCVVISRGRE